MKMLLKKTAELLQRESTTGIMLVSCTFLSLCLANVFVGYQNIWHLSFINHDLAFWIDNGLMSIFFLSIGLELKSEFQFGEFKNKRNVVLPLIAALSGMLCPFLMYKFFNSSTHNAGGAIPIATDIAFSVGVLSLLGKRVPNAVKIFLVAFSVFDDFGAIIVVGIVFTKNISLYFLTAASLVCIVLTYLRHKKINLKLPYIILGMLMWYFIYRSNIHASISGLLFALFMPTSNGDESKRQLTKRINLIVTLIVLPLFALSKTSIVIDANTLLYINKPNSLGIVFGLLLGKPIGIILSTYLSVKTGYFRLPSGMLWKHLIGAGIFAGIGFTMSLFISDLSFTEPQIVEQCKLSVLFASFFASLTGFFLVLFYKQSAEARDYPKLIHE